MTASTHPSCLQPVTFWWLSSPRLSCSSKSQESEILTLKVKRNSSVWWAVVQAVIWHRSCQTMAVFHNCHRIMKMFFKTLWQLQSETENEAALPVCEHQPLLWTAQPVTRPENQQQKETGFAFPFPLCQNKSSLELCFGANRTARMPRSSLQRSPGGRSVPTSPGARGWSLSQDEATQRQAKPG